MSYVEPSVLPLATVRVATFCEKVQLRKRPLDTWMLPDWIRSSWRIVPAPPRSS